VGLQANLRLLELKELLENLLDLMRHPDPSNLLPRGGHHLIRRER
jgi:hypothetical protein